MEFELYDTDNRVTDSRAKDDTWKLDGVGLLKDITARRAAAVLFLHYVLHSVVRDIITKINI